jgi:hypothetical protein
VLTIIALLGAGASGAACEEPQPAFNSGFEFSAVDARERIDYRLGRDLIVRVHRQANAQGIHIGWWLEARDRRLPRSPNLLYECLCGHGPQPADLLAWHLLTPSAVGHIGPLSERILPVWGYPYDLQVRCKGCEAQGDGALSAHFVRGRIEIGWRRLARSNPRQERTSEPRE